MVCPKCGHPRSAGPECPNCGIVYAKFRQAPEPSLAPPARRRGTRWPTAILVSALVATCAVAWIKLRTPSVGDGSRPLPSATPAIAQPRTTATEGDDTGPAPSELGGSSPAPAAPPLDEGARPPVEAVAEPALCQTFTLSDLPDRPPLPSVSSDWYEGASGFQRASDEQASSGAPLLLYFFVHWCPHCRRFTDEVLPSPEMRELGQRVVKVKVDAEGDEQDRALAQRLSVRSFPTLLVIASPGRPPARIDRWSSPRAFAESCQRLLPNSARDHLDRGIALSRGGSPEAAAAELKAAASDPALALGALDRLGLLALRASCFSRALTIFDRIRAIDSGYQTGRIYYLRSAARWRTGDPQGALDDAEQACRLGFNDGCAAAERIRPAVR